MKTLMNDLEERNRFNPTGALTSQQLQASLVAATGLLERWHLMPSLPSSMTAVAQKRKRFSSEEAV